MKISTPKLKVPKLKKPNFSWIKNLHPRRFNANTFLALLSYLYVLAFIPLIFSRRSDFVKYHAKQGIILLTVWTVGMFSFYLPVLPYLFILFILAEMIFGIVNVFLNRERHLFWIGKLAFIMDKTNSTPEKKNIVESVSTDPNVPERDVNWTVTLIMSIFFGSLGVDRFIMGDIFFGLLKLAIGLTAEIWQGVNIVNIAAGSEKFSVWPAILAIIFLIWWLTDIIRIASKSKFEGVKWV